MTMQRTLRRSVSLTGTGLHSGKSVTITLKPAPTNYGIRFLRTDLESSSSSHPITANVDSILSTNMATSVKMGKASLATVEHLLAALHGLQIDNVLVEVSGPEVPIMDGSAIEFVQALTEAGFENQKEIRSFLAIRKRVEFRIAEKWAVVEPADICEIHSTVEWDHPAIGYQEFQFALGQTDFSEIANARTFGFVRDVDALKKQGLILGGSLENAIVMDEGRVLNPEGLRYPDEIVRHKVLDAVGDLRLAGLSILGRFRLHRSGHDVHHQLLLKLLSEPQNFEIVSADSRPGELAEKLQSAFGLDRLFN